MISFEEAQKRIEEYIPIPEKEEITISGSLGFVNAEDLKSPVDLPLFNNSAMDGFLLNSEDVKEATSETPIFLNVVGVIKAGDENKFILKRNEACRIMTGSLVGKGGDAVLEKEKAFLQENLLVIKEPITKGRNIRLKGEELKKGEMALTKGAVINPGTIGFLATMGISKIKVYKKPKISLIATGSELVPSGDPLKPGKIYDSNTPMIQATLGEMRIHPFFVRRLPDRPKDIEKVIQFALQESDILILMGGVSVGDYDYVKELLQKIGVKTVFWNVSQKPGKPLYFGVKDEHLVFGLPGNPASVFTCFYEYVYPAIRRFMGYREPYLVSEQASLEGSLNPDAQKTLFIKSYVKQNGTGKKVLPLKRQKSHMLSSLCEANSFLVVPKSDQTLQEGEKVLVHSLPYALNGS